MYALALQEVFLRLDEDLEGFLEEDLDEDLEEPSFFLKNFFVFFSSSESLLFHLPLLWLYPESYLPVARISASQRGQSEMK